MATFNIYADPGHSWARVPRTLLRTLNVDEDISPFSYERGEFVYLEEDADLTKFINAYRSSGKTVNFKYFHTNKQSKIRSYDCYTILVDI